MRVQNNVQKPSSKPNFQAIKSETYKGLYKQFPQYRKGLMDTFKKNPKAMEFCEKYDVDVVFDARRQAWTDVVSSIKLIFDNPAKTKFLGIFGSTKDKVSLSNYSEAYNVENSLKSATEGLKGYIAKRVIGENAGLLESHIKYKEYEIQNLLDKKTAKSK